MKLGFFGLVAFSMLVPFAVCADTPIRPGVYEIDVETLMPHLEENLRYAHIRLYRCLRREDLPLLFPVLEHKSLAGCRLDGVGRDEAFQLVCENRATATGRAHLKVTGDTVFGELNVKMGGKNMTFSQRVDARWQTSCGVVDEGRPR